MSSQVPERESQKWQKFIEQLDKDNAAKTAQQAGNANPATAASGAGRNPGLSMPQPARNVAIGRTMYTAAGKQLMPSGTVPGRNIIIPKKRLTATGLFKAPDGQMFRPDQVPVPKGAQGGSQSPAKKK